MRVAGGAERHRFARAVPLRTLIAACPRAPSPDARHALPPRASSAFCWTCSEDDGTLNKHCEAVMQKYQWWSTKSQGGDGHTPSDAKGYALANLTNYWCTDEVLSAVEDGTYKDKLIAGIL